MTRIPGDHRGEGDQADDHGQVRPGASEPGAGRRFEHQVEEQPDGEEHRVVLAQEPPAPRQADPEPGDEPPRRLERDDEAVERQEPEEQERAVRQDERAGRDANVGLGQVDDLVIDPKSDTIPFAVISLERGKNADKMPPQLKSMLANVDVQKDSRFGDLGHQRDPGRQRAGRGGRCI